MSFLKIRFHYLFYIGLSQSHYLNFRPDRLTRVDFGHFFLLFSIKLSRFHDPSNMFDKLTHVNFFCYFLN